jgi:two-component system sensor histidine kinase ChiS
LILIVALVLDILGGRAILNLPPLLTYVFVLFVISMALILVNGFVSLQDQTENLNKQLAQFNKASSRFVPFAFLNLLEKGSIVDVNLGDQVQKEMTVLFSDIRSFTSLSETMTPRENFDFINSYLRRMGPVIRQHGGFIDKYIGDAVMALFATDPDSAILSAIAMHHQLHDWNVSRQKHGMVPIRIGVGIHLGRLMLGTIGENERMEGTVIADTVNLASRIESLTKLYGASVLISGETRAALKNPESFQLRKVDRVRVQGKTSAVDLYELLDALKPVEMAQKINERPHFEQAMQYYVAGKLDAAEHLFRKVYGHTTDPAADIMVRRCQSLKQSGLPENWDGTTTLKIK